LSLPRLFAAVAILALAVGTALWVGSGPQITSAKGADVSPSALYAATFADTRGASASLGRFQGKVLVVNFWATWCAPCRDEMPAFTRLQARWAGRGVQFIGLSDEDPRRVMRFGQDLSINYPLWVGGDEVGALARRLGNHLGVLPFTVLVDGQGHVLESRAGTYSEARLESRLSQIFGEKGAYYGETNATPVKLSR
jgi:thiol-disulfide isomerase/thioredoxin